MKTVLFWLGIALLITHVLIGFEIIVGSRQIRFLRDFAPVDPEVAPKASVIAAARNEERNIRGALQSLLDLDYPDLQVVLVNDRSEDRTGDIFEEMAASDPRLEIVHVSELPDQWLGKNHALWQGSQKATGDILLFTDADVVMAPDTLSRAAACMRVQGADHLAATPEARMPSLFLNMFAATFGFFFGIFTRPWRAADPRSRCHIGIGAFNLVRTEVYRKVGGHQTIALRPDDDLKLGKIIKKSGFRQRLVYGTDLISVEWYANIREVVVGLEKNVFAGTDYRLWLAMAGVFFQLGAILWPYLALFATAGATLAVYAACVAVISVVVADGARFNGFNPWYALGFPLTAGFLAFIVVRTVICNLVQGGITWRGTFYPLSLLRKNKI